MKAKLPEVFATVPEGGIGVTADSARGRVRA